MMCKWMYLIFIVVGFSTATKLISSDQVEVLFRKFALKTITPDENGLLQDVFQILKSPQHITQETFDARILSGIDRPLSCLLCRSAFAALFDVVTAGQTDEEATDVIVEFCLILNLQSEEVCRGAVSLNMPILTYIIRTVRQATPDAFCALILQTSDQSDVCALNDVRYEWQVDLPTEQSPGANVPDSTTAAPLKIAILTDAHIDPLYEAYGVAECDEPVCCRKGQRPRASAVTYNTDYTDVLARESVIDDNGRLMLDLDVAIKIKQIEEYTAIKSSARHASPAGYWGDYRDCDSPIWAYDDVIDTIYENHPDVDVIYYVGDSIDHGVWETSYDLINEMNTYVIDKLRNTFGEDVPIVPVIGNHESQPTNQFAPSYVTDEGLNTTWLYDALAVKWGPYLTQEAMETLRERGDFSVLVKPGLRVISINNNVAYRYNWWLVFDPQDAKRHLDFLIEELYKAEVAGERVHILNHIPPGAHDLIYTWTREYNKIINRFSSIIKAEFNGHIHSDEFKIFYNEERSPINVAWGAGAATAYRDYNMNYKIATFDGSSYEPIDIVSYVYNLTEANLTPNRRPHWFQLYSMRNRFGIEDITATSLNNLVNTMVTTNKQLLDLYAAFAVKLSDTRWPWCNEECKLNFICRSVVTVLWDHRRCEELRNAYSTIY